MSDPITIVAAVGTIFTSMKELVRSAKDVAEKIEDIERRGKLLELMEQLQRTQLQAMEQLFRAAELENENKVLKQQLALTESMTFDGMLYWQDEGNDRKGPFCQRCFDDDGKAVRLQEGWDRYSSPWRCTRCKESYGQGDPYPEPEELPSY